MSKLFSTLKKYSFLVLFICSLFFGLNVFAQNNPTEVIPPVIAPTGTPVIGSYTGNCDPSKDENCYQFLEALPTSEGDLTSVNTGADKKKGTGLGEFITFAFEIGVGVAGVLGVVMLTIYGFQYAANDKNIANFEVLKEKITKVILGLLLLLGIFVILNTINPDLLIVEPNIDEKKLEIALDDTEDPVTEIKTPQQLGQGFTAFRQFAANNGIYCPGSGGSAAIPQIAQSMVGKITYSMPNRFSHGPGNTWYLDCSGFVHTVYLCAGLPSPGTYTGSIFSQKKPINGATAKIGDLIGWTAGDGGKKYGHVIMFIGNGKTIESHGGDGKKTGNALIMQNVSTVYSKYRKYIRPI